MRNLVLPVIILLVALTALPVVADSLWTVGTSPNANLYSDPKAYKVGDLLTVLVAEQVTSNLKASTEYVKDQANTNTAGTGPLLTWVPEFGFSSNQNSAASGQATVANNLMTKITLTVTNVLPNGNLEVGGQRLLETNGEKQTMTVTATVRPQDISRDNTVLSTDLANLQATYSGKGPISNRQREGIISKLVRFIF